MNLPLELVVLICAHITDRDFIRFVTACKAFKVYYRLRELQSEYALSRISNCYVRQQYIFTNLFYDAAHLVSPLNRELRILSLCDEFNDDLRVIFAQCPRLTHVRVGMFYTNTNALSIIPATVNKTDIIISIISNCICANRYESEIAIVTHGINTFDFPYVYNARLIHKFMKRKYASAFNALKNGEVTETSLALINSIIFDVDDNQHEIIGIIQKLFAATDIYRDYASLMTRPIVSDNQTDDLYNKISGLLSLLYIIEHKQYTFMQNIYSKILRLYGFTSILHYSEYCHVQQHTWLRIFENALDFTAANIKPGTLIMCKDNARYYIGYYRETVNRSIIVYDYWSFPRRIGMTRAEIIANVRSRCFEIDRIQEIRIGEYGTHLSSNINAHLQVNWKTLIESDAESDAETDS